MFRSHVPEVVTGEVGQPDQGEGHCGNGCDLVKAGVHRTMFRSHVPEVVTGEVGQPDQGEGHCGNGRKQ